MALERNQPGGVYTRQQILDQMRTLQGRYKSGGIPR
jgi:hypothetical protein